jgi:hypothetical protein
VYYGTVEKVLMNHPVFHVDSVSPYVLVTP